MFRSFVTPGACAVAFLTAVAPALAGQRLSVDAIVPQVAGVRDLGRASGATTVSVALTLRYRHDAELDALVDAQADADSPLYRRFLSNAQFDAYFAPAPDAYGRVLASLQRAGFRITGTYENRTLVDAEAPARVAERYFATEIHAVSQPGFGVLYANARPGTIPRDIAGDVDTVVGLDNLQKARYMNERGTRPARVAPDAIGGKLHGPDGGFGPVALANGFDFPVQHGFDGTGRAVANVAGDVHDRDVATFLAYFGIARTGTTVRTKIQTPGPAANGEAILDVETMAALDPGATVHLYILSNPIDKPGEDAYNQIVSDDSVDAVNSSFGVCEQTDPAYVTAALKLVKQGEAKGISWSASTGDGGANGCSGPQIAPAALPRVTGVGGTSLFVDASGAYKRESAWNFGGGGPSSTFALPKFQRGVTGLASPTRRNLPDIAFPADPNTGYSLYDGGNWVGPTGGTSWSSPTFVALVAELDQIENGRAGFINPAIYRAFKKQGYAAFHDVTTGNNGFPAKAGYDDATGIGSLRAYAFTGFL